MENTFNIEKTFRLKEEKHWDTIYFAVDLHGTIIKPSHDRVEFYPDAVEVIKWMNSRNDVRVILWTASHQAEITGFLYQCGVNEIHMDFVNENPNEKGSEKACFDHKFYFNILLEDKAGFIGETDWTKIKNCLIELKQW